MYMNTIDLFSEMWLQWYVKHAVKPLKYVHFIYKTNMFYILKIHVSDKTDIKSWYFNDVKIIAIVFKFYIAVFHIKSVA